MKQTQPGSTGTGSAHPRSSPAISYTLVLLMLFLVAACSDSAATQQLTPARSPAPSQPTQPMSMGQGQGNHGRGGRQHVMGGSTSAAYMTLRNSGDTSDALVAASTDAAETVELHTVIEEGGVMKMRPVPQIDIPAAGEQQLRPGGYHVMLIGITRDLNEGDTVHLTLTLEKGGALELAVPVRMMPPEGEVSEISASSGAITVVAPWVRAAVMAPAE